MQIETYSEILDPHYYAAFSWSLLDSVADTSKAPPKLRPFREIRCITKLENEAVSNLCYSIMYFIVLNLFIDLCRV